MERNSKTMNMESLKDNSVNEDFCVHKANVDKLSEMETEQPELTTVEYKMIFGRLGMKLLRFFFLGHLYYSYEVLDCLPNVSLRRFPSIYLYTWTIISIGLGIFLFVFGRPSLTSASEINYVFQLDNKRSPTNVYSLVLVTCLNFILNGPLYRYVNLVLNFIYPYIVVSTISCYSPVQISHSKFLISYYVSLAFAQLNSGFQLIRWFAFTLAILTHFIISFHVGNWWGVFGSTVMIPAMILVAKDDHNYVFSSKLKWVPNPGTVVHALVAMVTSFTITMSFVGMSSFVDEELVDVPEITKEELFSYLKILPFANNLFNLDSIITNNSTHIDEL